LFLNTILSDLLMYMILSMVLDKVLFTGISTPIFCLIFFDKNAPTLLNSKLVCDVYITVFLLRPKALCVGIIFKGFGIKFSAAKLVCG